MRKTNDATLWVVYRTTFHGNPSQISAVCRQMEWDALELARPGHHTLILAGIANEGEAERLARLGSMDGNTSLPSWPAHHLTSPFSKSGIASSSVGMPAILEEDHPLDKAEHISSR